MFGFSLPKILFTVVIIVVVWQAFKWLNRRGELQQRRAEEVERDAATRARSAEVEDMVQCPDCGAYVPQGSNHRCG
ncbi:MAG: hypothetical protein VW338_09830 [Rhodospirillaceae bacterium]|jgi:hypothetical protein